MSERLAAWLGPANTPMSVPATQNQPRVGAQTASAVAAASAPQLLSAMAPSTGASSATTIPAIATPRDHNAVPVTTSGANFCAKYAE